MYGHRQLRLVSTRRDVLVLGALDVRIHPLWTYVTLEPSVVPSNVTNVQSPKSGSTILDGEALLVLLQRRGRHRALSQGYHLYHRVITLTTGFITFTTGLSPSPQGYQPSPQHRVITLTTGLSRVITLTTRLSPLPQGYHPYHKVITFTTAQGYHPHHRFITLGSACKLSLEARLGR